jgi:hypothetical protein
MASRKKTAKKTAKKTTKKTRSARTGKTLRQIAASTKTTRASRRPTKAPETPVATGRKAPPVEGGLVLSEAVPSYTVKNASYNHRESVYRPVIEKAKTLGPNESFLVDVPQGMEPAILVSRLNNAFVRFKHELPSGVIFRRRVTADGKVAISCKAV